MLQVADDIRISPATLADMHEIDRIEREAFATPWSSDLIRAAILNKQYNVRVMRTPESSVSGFTITHAIKDKSNLDNFAVDRPLRGLGLGNRMLADWIDRSYTSRASTLSLQVNTSNKGAQRLYREFKFKIIRLLVAYYPNGDDAYQMELALHSLRGAPAQ